MASTTTTTTTTTTQESNLPTILGVVGTFHLLALTTASLRFYTRGFLVKSFRRDDYMMLAAILCAATCMVLLILEGRHGLGKRTATLSPQDRSARAKLDFFLILIANAGLFFLKGSIALALLPLSGSYRWIKWIIWGMMVFIGAYTIIALVTNIFYCIPISGYWDPSVNATCYSAALFIKFALANSAFTILSDIVLALLPVPIIWNLQMKTKLRLYLIGILSLGYFAVAMCAVKVHYQFNFALETDNVFFYHVQFYLLLEYNIGIISACLPSLKPLFSRALRLTTTGAYKSSNSRYLGYGDRQTTTTTTTTGRAASRLPHRSGYVLHKSVDGGPEDFELSAVAARKGLTTTVEGGGGGGRDALVYGRGRDDPAATGSSELMYTVEARGRTPRLGEIIVTKETNVRVTSEAV